MTKAKKTFLPAPSIAHDLFENDFTVKIYHVVDEKLSRELVNIGKKVTEYSIGGRHLLLKHKVSDDVVQEVRELHKGLSGLRVCISHGSYHRELLVTYSQSKCDKASKYNATPLLFTLTCLIESDVYV